MTTLRKPRTAEQELMESVADGARWSEITPNATPCSSETDLRRFVAGKYESSPDREKLLAHLGTCERCISVLTQIRQRRILTRRTAFALATAAVIIVALWANFERPTDVSLAVARIDLREISPTRGTENHNGVAAAKVRGDAGRLRIILPPGAEGSYDVQVVGQPGSAQPLIQASGVTRLEKQDVTLDLPVSLRGFSPGRYAIALRRKGSEWAYYSLIVE